MTKLRLTDSTTGPYHYTVGLAPPWRGIVGRCCCAFPVEQHREWWFRTRKEADRAAALLTLGAP